MKFIYKEQEEKKITFNDVKENQFFICHQGRLCQKVTKTSAYIIADEKGKPNADRYSSLHEYLEINLILPEVERIEF